MNNGGFDQFFFNSPGDHAQFTVSALDVIGAHTVASLLREANAHFGSEGPPQDIIARGDMLIALTEGTEDFFQSLDEKFYAYPENLEALLKAYLKAVPN